jgi:hypothetical protein
MRLLREYKARFFSEIGLCGWGRSIKLNYIISPISRQGCLTF